MPTIPLTKNQYAIVDEDVYPVVSKFKWHACKLGNSYYAMRSNGKETIMMHRFILNILPCFGLDHVNGNGLDNRRCNLRLATRSENGINQFLSKANTSGYKGVVWKKEKDVWEAKIMKNYKSIHIGYYEDKVDAAKAYDEKARELFGEYARFNFPKKGERGIRTALCGEKE